MKTKISAILFSCLLVSGCSKETTMLTSLYNFPEGWEDCEVARMTSPNDEIYAVRCPESTVSTTYSSGKIKKTTVVDSPRAVLY